MTSFRCFFFFFSLLQFYLFWSSVLPFFGRIIFSWRDSQHRMRNASANSKSYTRSLARSVHIVSGNIASLQMLTDKRFITIQPIARWRKINTERKTLILDSHQCEWLNWCARVTAITFLQLASCYCCCYCQLAQRTSNRTEWWTGPKKNSTKKRKNRECAKRRDTVEEDEVVWVPYKYLRRHRRH